MGWCAGNGRDAFRPDAERWAELRRQRFVRGWNLGGRSELVRWDVSSQEQGL